MNKNKNRQIFKKRSRKKFYNPVTRESLRGEIWPSLYNCGDEVTDGFFSRKKETDPNKCEPKKIEKKPDSQGCGKPAKKDPCKDPCKKPEKKDPCKKVDPCKPVKRDPCAKKPVKRDPCPCPCPVKPPCNLTNEKRKARKSNKCGDEMERSINPFIIFFLMMLRKCPNRKVTEIAKEAGKQWCCMSCEQKEIYKRAARIEQKRRKRKNKSKQLPCRAMRKKKRKC